MLPDGFTGDVGAADIHVSPDGRFLYASNRGSANDIVTYSINQENGQLTYVDRVSCLGKGPRNFVIDPTGSFLLVANQNSDSIITYKIDKNTGKLNPTGVRLTIGNPVCLKFSRHSKISILSFFTTFRMTTDINAERLSKSESLSAFKHYCVFIF